MNENEAAAEAESIAKMARGQETVRIDGLTDEATIKKYFSDRFVKYDYTVSGRRFVGIIVTKAQAGRYTCDGMSGRRNE